MEHGRVAWKGVRRADPSVIEWEIDSAASLAGGAVAPSVDEMVVEKVRGSVASKAY
jgi:hypothetical protein